MHKTSSLPPAISLDNAPSAPPELLMQWPAWCRVEDAIREACREGYGRVEVEACGELLGRVTSRTSPPRDGRRRPVNLTRLHVDLFYIQFRLEVCLMHSRGQARNFVVRVQDHAVVGFGEEGGATYRRRQRRKRKKTLFTP